MSFEKSDGGALLRSRENLLLVLRGKHPKTLKRFSRKLELR